MDLHIHEDQTQGFFEEMIRRIVDRFHPERIILFGSYARGNPTSDSDLDIIVVLPVQGSTRKKANEIDLALADRTVPLDLIVVTPEQFQQQRKIIGSIVSEALREGKVVYEAAA